MSNPTRTQQRFPFRTPVRVQRNNPRLPPITTPIRPIEPENEPIASALSFSKIEVKCETPPIENKDFWVRVHEDIVKSRLEHSNEHGNQNTPNKVVRIFVSSTFTDFFNEREVLIKRVFTALRDEMEPAGIQIIDCDLRWGVSRIKINLSIITLQLGSKRFNNRTNDLSLSRRTRSMFRR